MTLLMEGNDDVSDAAPDLNDGNWIRACAVDDIAPGEAVAIPLDPPIAVYNVDGEFLAVDDTCTHEEFALSEGYIQGDIVECAFHFSKFNLRTGEALTPPAYDWLKTYETYVADGEVYVNLASRNAAEGSSPSEGSGAA